MKKICVRREKVYGKDEIMYERGLVKGIYTNHILVEFEYESGNKVRESFFESELKKEKELNENEHIY